MYDFGRSSEVQKELFLLVPRIHFGTFSSSVEFEIISIKVVLEPNLFYKDSNIGSS